MNCSMILLSVFLLTILSDHPVLGCKTKKVTPPPPPRCKHPEQTKLKTSDESAVLHCTGFGNRYFNEPKVSDDKAKALLKEGGVIENGTLVIKEELIAPQKEDVESTECYLVCSNGYIPSPTSTTSCTNGQWTQDPATMTCEESPCGSPGQPNNGHYHCYGNPSICYLTCNPGYSTMSSSPMVTCQEGGTWDQDPLGMECEEAVALITGGIGKEPGTGPYPERCHTAEVFSPWDATCSTLLSPLLKIGVHDHTTHLVNGEILLCGGSECGRVSEKLFSKTPIYNQTKTHQSCFMMLPNNSWTFHSEFPDWSWRWNHQGAVQQNILTIIGGHDAALEPMLELTKAGWVRGHTPSLPPTVWPITILRPCVVVTSPTTFLVTGGSYDMLARNHLSSVLEFNSLTKEWRALPDMPVGRGDHACAVVQTGHGDALMIAGGRNREEQKYPLRDAHIFDFKTKVWMPAGRMKHGRESFEMIVLGKRIFVLGSSSFVEGRYTPEEETIEEYRIPESKCKHEYLKLCPPGEEGSWVSINRDSLSNSTKIARRTGHSVVAVPASRFNCTIGH